MKKKERGKASRPFSARDRRNSDSRRRRRRSGTRVQVIIREKGGYELTISIQTNGEVQGVVVHQQGDLSFPPHVCEWAEKIVREHVINGQLHLSFGLNGQGQEDY